MKRALAALIVASFLTGTAIADYNITQTFDPAPTYSGGSANFDEPGVPIGVAMDPFTFYSASQGLTFTSGNGFLVAEDWDALEGIDGGEGDGNQLNGGFGIRMLFDQDVTELSWQGWANGNPAPPFGSINVFVFDDGNQVASYSGIAPFGGVGDEWFNVVGKNGDVFDEVVFFNGAFNSFNSYVDNISFNNIPEPASIAVLAVVSLGLLRRRR